VGEDLNISDAEWIVMEAMWGVRRGSAADIIARLAESTIWNHRTVRTLLGRLVDKGFIERIEQQGGSDYRPLVKRTHCVRREGRTFMQRVFGGDTNSLLLHFAQEARLSPEKLQRLRALLDENEE